MKPAEASVKLQELIDHTVKRLIEFLDLDTTTTEESMTVIFKWGCDGSSNHSRYLSFDYTFMHILNYPEKAHNYVLQT